MQEPMVMGILNLSPESFYTFTESSQESGLLKQVEYMLANGAAMIDIGAASSKPGAEEISPEEELRRLIPAVQLLLKAFPELIISIDTYRAAVARTALDCGAAIINDITAGEDPAMFATLASFAAPYIMMHKKGTPAKMQLDPQYEDVVEEVKDFFIHKIHTARRAGVNDIIIDPGFGFGKTVEHNYQLLSALRSFGILDCPILAGLSRKSMICKVLHVNPDKALNGTTALHMAALMKGAKILRAHDVKEAVETVKLFQAMELQA
jgi:dihydropteroate synthase